MINVVRVEFLRRVVRLVTGRKHEGRSTDRKTLLKGKLVTSHIYYGKDLSFTKRVKTYASFKKRLIKLSLTKDIII
jgi:hypothetical protein